MHHVMLLLYANPNFAQYTVLYHSLNNCRKINVGFPTCDPKKVHRGVVIWKVSQSFSAAVLPPPLLSFPLLCLFLLMCHHSQEIPQVFNGSKTFLLHEPVPFPLCPFLLIFLLLFSLHRSVSAPLFLLLNSLQHLLLLTFSFNLSLHLSLPKSKICRLT